MARNSTPNTARKGTDTARKGTESAATVAAPTAPAPTAPARVAFVMSGPGRPDAALSDAIGRAFDMLSHAVARIPAPREFPAPRNASPRVRAAIAADNAAESAAYEFLRAAVAAGRAANRK